MTQLVVGYLGESKMIQWIHAHPYMFFSMYVLTLFTVMTTVAEISKAFSSKMKKEKTDA